MVTEWYEAYSLEEGDQIVTFGDVFKITLISSTDDGYRLTVINEEQDMKHIDCTMSAKFKVLCD
jgi:hypothetical protein